MSTYRTQATAIGGRHGSVASCDGALKLRLDKPKELDGPGGTGTNPEQLFAAGYAACFMESLKLLAADTGDRIAEDSNVTATVTLGPSPDGEGMQLTAALAVDLPDLSREAAQALAARAHAACPYSKAVRGNLDVRVSIP